MLEGLKRAAKGPIPAPWRQRLRRIALRCWYAGSTYECPFCECRFRRLLPFGLDLPVLREKRVVGGGRRENALCPLCCSTDRERLLYLYLRSCTRTFSDRLRLLHLAPERRLRDALGNAPHIQYVSGDIDRRDVMVRLDVSRMPFRDDSFDAILCNHVLEHVGDDRKAMAELLRVLRPGGWAILQVPLALALERTIEDPTLTDPAERERRFGQSDHVRLYACDYKERLERVGFLVETVPFARQLGEATARRHGLVPEETIHLCRKPAG